MGSQVISFVSTLYDAVADQAIPHLHRFRNWELVLLVWAFGKVKYSHKQLLKNVLEESIRRITGSIEFPYKPMGNANIVKGFARLNFKPRSLLPLAFQNA